MSELLDPAAVGELVARLEAERDHALEVAAACQGSGECTLPALAWLAGIAHERAARVTRLEATRLHRPLGGADHSCLMADCDGYGPYLQHVLRGLAAAAARFAPDAPAWASRTEETLARQQLGAHVAVARRLLGEPRPQQVVRARDAL